MVILLGLKPLLKALLICLNVLLGGILLVSLLSGSYLLVLMLMVLLEGLQMILMFGLMVVWLMTRFLGFLLLVRVASPFGFVGFGTCWNWGHWDDDDVHDGSVVSACRGFLSVPGPLQTVQRAELWGVILALQAGDGIHLGVDNFGVVRHVGRILDGRPPSRPFELLPDGDLLFLFERMLSIRG